VPAYYFLPVPKLPRNVAHQSGLVTLVRYLVAEGETIHPGSGIAVVENWWATIRIEATTPGVVSKLFFEPGTAIKVEDPMAIVIVDGEDLPRGPRATVRVMEMKRLPGSRGTA
jgi:pyruvate/2-oxoglutarate dehydrogenase complex dihydrolipoamide acyltransferase (E2) component